MTHEETEVKLTLFRHWLKERTAEQHLMLLGICASTKQPIDAVRMKYGAWEAYNFISQAFEVLLLESADEFGREYLHLGDTEEPVDENESTRDSADNGT